MTILSLLVTLVLICLFVWAVRSVMGAFGIGNPMAGLVNVVMVVLVICWLLSVFGLLDLGLPVRFR